MTSADGLRTQDADARAAPQHRAILDAIPAIAWCKLPDGSNEFVNQRCPLVTRGTPAMNSHASEMARGARVRVLLRPHSKSSAASSDEPRTVSSLPLAVSQTHAQSATRSPSARSSPPNAWPSRSDPARRAVPPTWPPKLFRLTSKERARHARRSGQPDGHRLRASLTPQSEGELSHGLREAHPPHRHRWHRRHWRQLGRAVSGARLRRDRHRSGPERGSQPAQVR